MADATKSLWSRWMEGGSENLSNIGAAKPTCPYDRKSCKKAHDPVVNGSPKSSDTNCHSGCREPKRPLRPEEFCPDFGKAKPPPSPPCCFIRMQDPCAPCCCPAPKKCEDECYPGRKRDPICGCDLCKKKLCPDGKCCGPTEPSCQKGVKNLTHLEKAWELYAGATRNHKHHPNIKENWERKPLTFTDIQSAQAKPLFVTAKRTFQRWNLSNGSSIGFSVRHWRSPFLG